MIKCVVVVAFEPDVESLIILCNKILNQESIPIIVDNSENKCLIKKSLPGGVILLSLGKNEGIAYAQNKGIVYAINSGAKIITLLDQDSIISDKLLCILQEAIHSNCEVVAPVTMDIDTGNEYPSQCLNKYGLPYDVYAKDLHKPKKVDIVISSGTTISINVFKKVGLFNNDFFIDFVDIEWCLRCKKQRIPIYVIPNAIMEHCIGIKTVKCGWITVNMHSPARTYYKVRNSILLLKKDINKVFCLRQISSALVLNFVGIIGNDDWKDYCKYYISGIKDGISGKCGKYQR